MRTIDSDKTSKRVRMIFGLILLVFVSVGVVIVALNIMTFLNYSDSVPAITTDNETVIPRAVRFEQPLDIRGTDTQLVILHHGRGYYITEDTVGKVTSVGNVYSSYEPIVNVIFLNANGDGHLLFEQPVVIKDIYYPQESDAQSNQNQEWILYEVVAADTSGDKKLGDADRVDLYISDIEGSGLKRLLDDNYTIASVTDNGSGTRIIIYAYKLRDSRRIVNDDLRQWAFIYDPATKKTAPYDALNDLTSKAASILAK